jgi:DNA polymerase III delta prime subunit
VKELLDYLLTGNMPHLLPAPPTGYA